MRRILLTLALLMTSFALPAHAAGPLPPITDQDLIKGSPKAKVTVVEYFSLSCPHCADWAKDVFPQVEKDLIDTGKIRYVFRDFPLNAPALYAAQLAHCEPDKYFGFVEVLFESQPSWVIQDSVPELDKIAKLGGIPETKFQACIADKALQNSVIASRQGGTDAGVEATPTFFFNGKAHAGAMSYDDFVKLAKDAGL
jgi:protein-disulfide isomerase